MRPRTAVATLADHARAAAIAAAFATALGLLAWSTAARAAEYAHYEPLPLPTGSVARNPALITLPAAWDSGDTLAMVLVAGPDGQGLRVQLIADLIHRGVAVAELTVDAPHAAPDQIAAAAQGAVAAARDRFGAGTVLLYGLASDAGGEAALLAATPSDLPPQARVNAAAMLGEACQVATPYWEQPEEWRLHAIHRASHLVPPPAQRLSPAWRQAVLDCAMALVPGADWWHWQERR